MGRLIDFKDFNANRSSRENDDPASKKTDMVRPVLISMEPETQFKLTLNILIHNHPGKECFSVKEVVEKLGVGEEFLRRRIKSGKIKATYLGDKPFISIVELARIITEGV